MSTKNNSFSTWSVKESCVTNNSSDHAQGEWCAMNVDEHKLASMIFTAFLGLSPLLLFAISRIGQTEGSGGASSELASGVLHSTEPAGEETGTSGQVHQAVTVEPSAPGVPPTQVM